MADFLFLFRNEHRAQSPEEMQKNMQKWVAWMNDLKAKGHFKSGEPLDRGAKLVKGRSKVVTDGPFAEAKDMVNGFLLITAKNLDQATDLSKGCPIFEDDGSVEVRPILQMSM